MDPKLSKNWHKAEPRLQDLPTANLGRISDPQVAIRPSSPAPEDAAVWLHPAAVLPAPQIANLWRAPEPEIATQRYLTYIPQHCSPVRSGAWCWQRSGVGCLGRHSPACRLQIVL